MVEVGDVLGQHTTQMALIQDQKVIQTFGPDRSNPSLRNGIGLGRSKRSTDGCDKSFSGDSVELEAIPPDQLRELVEACIVQHIDGDKLDKTKIAEASERELLMQWDDILEDYAGDVGDRGVP